MDAIQLWSDQSMPRSILKDFWELVDTDAQKPRTSFSNRHKSFRPVCDIKETEKNYVLTFDVPGMKKEDIEIEMLKDKLVVSGERKLEEVDEKEGFSRIERSFGKFSREFSLPEGSNAELITANYEDGVLGVFIPKAAEIKAKKIEIGSGKDGILKSLSKNSGKKAVN